MRRRQRRQYGGNREIVDYIYANTRVTGPEVRTGQDIPSMFEFCRRNGYTDIAVKWSTSPGNHALDDFDPHFSDAQLDQIAALPWVHPIAGSGDVYRIMNIYGLDSLGSGQGYVSSMSNIIFEAQFPSYLRSGRPSVELLADPDPTRIPTLTPRPTLEPTPSVSPTVAPTPTPVPDNPNLVVSMFLWMYSGFEIINQWVFDTNELEKVVGCFNVRHVSGSLVKQRFLIEGQLRSFHLEGDLNILAIMRDVEKDQTPQGVCLLFSWEPPKVDLQMSCRILAPLSWI